MIQRRVVVPSVDCASGSGGRDALARAVPCSADPLSLSVAVPEGNYRVTVKLGDADAASSTTVKSENRRLMLEDVADRAG